MEISSVNENKICGECNKEVTDCLYATVVLNKVELNYCPSCLFMHFYYHFMLKCSDEKRMLTIKELRAIDFFKKKGKEIESEKNYTGGLNHLIEKFNSVNWYEEWKLKAASGKTSWEAIDMNRNGSGELTITCAGCKTLFKVPFPNVGNLPEKVELGGQDVTIQFYQYNFYQNLKEETGFNCPDCNIIINAFK